MKSFKELRESLNPSMVQTTVDANIINNLVKFAQQLSGAFQPDMILIINKIENELNKFGLTLGDVDVDTPFEDSGTDDYVILFYATKDPVKNMFLTLSWRKISGKQFEYTQEGAKLIHDVHLIVNITDPEDMDDILNSEDGDDEMTFVHLDEATIKTKEYSWGKMKTIHHGNDWSIPLHPEHQKMISSLEDEGEARFKDETGVKWTAKRFGDTIHFIGGDRGTYYGGDYKTSVLRKHLIEETDSLDGDDEQDCIKEALSRHEQGWDKSKSKIFGSKGKYEVAFVHPKTDEEITKTLDANDIKHAKEQIRKKHGDNVRIINARPLEEASEYNFDVSLTATHADTDKELLHQTTVRAKNEDEAYSKAKSEMLKKYPKATYIANIHRPSGSRIDREQLDEISNKYNINKGMKKKFCDFRSNHDNLTESKDETDTIKINVPAFIRCLEHAMEDVKEDAELHKFVENLLEISKTKDVITTDDYEKAVSHYEDEDENV